MKKKRVAKSKVSYNCINIVAKKFVILPRTLLTTPLQLDSPVTQKKRGVDRGSQKEALIRDWFRESEGEKKTKTKNRCQRQSAVR